MHIVSLRLLLGIAVALGFAVTPVSTRAANQIRHLDVGDRWAEASFTAPIAGDQTGCLIGLYDVQITEALDVKLKEEPGKPFTGSFSAAGLTIIEFNTCTSQVTKFHECSLVGSTGLAIAPNLARASVATTVTCFDPYDETLPTYAVALDIAWTATSPPLRRFRHERLNGLGEKVNTRLRHVSRFATATGSILLDGVNLISGESDSARLVDENRAAHALFQCKQNPDLCQNN